MRSLGRRSSLARISRLLSNPFFLLGFTIWQGIVLFTPISLYGFWTDISLFLIWFVWLAFNDAERWVRWASRAVFGLGVAAALALFSSLGGMFFFFELIGTRSLPQENKLQGPWLVNQYFIPVGAYGCGQGRLITAKALVFFPLLEYRTAYDPCTAISE